MECNVTNCENTDCAHHGRHKENAHCSGFGCRRHRTAECIRVHPDDCTCGKYTGEDRALKQMERGIVAAERARVGDE